VDVVETGSDIDPFTLRQPGVAGSVILRNRTTLVVDPFELADRSWPGWNPDAEAAAAAPAAGAQILVVEDSGFFREHIGGILQDAGWKVIPAEDGEAGWGELESRGAEIALVVTDVEMPRLDGLQFTRRLRGDARFSAMPVLMLTSLAGDENMQRGYEAGATAYSVKIDRDELIAAVRKLLAGRAPDPCEPSGGLPNLCRHVGEFPAVTHSVNGALS